MQNKIVDNIKEYRKNIWIIFIFIVVLGFGQIYLSVGKMPLKDTIIICLFWFVLFLFAIYWSIKVTIYRIIISDKQIEIRTIFGKDLIEISNVEYYICKRHRETVFYGFVLYHKGKKKLLYTRYKTELEKLLNDNKVEVRSK